LNPSRRKLPLMNAEISPQNNDILLQIASLIRLAEGFRLGFVKCNQPVQCRQMAVRLKEMLAGEAKIIDVDLSEPVSSLRRAILKKLEAEKSSCESKQVIMVFGFEHSVPSKGPAPVLDELNQSREIFPKDVSGPLLIWLPDYALTRLAREAPDFWGWRSGVFEFVPDLRLMSIIEKMAAQDAEASNLGLNEKRERVAALEGLIRDYKELQHGERVGRGQAAVLHRSGNIHHQLGEYEEAKRLYEESLKINQELGDKSGMAATLHQMGNMAYGTGDIGEASRLYEESLKINQELGDKSGVAKALHQMGSMAYDTGDIGEASRQYEESLKINQELGDRSGVAKTLHQMGNMAYDTGDIGEAGRLYEESLKINQELGDKSGVAATLHQIGMIAQDAGDMGEARRLYEESLKINQELGNKSGVAATLHQMGRMAQDAGDIGEAWRLYEESLRIKQELGDKSGVAVTLHQMGRMAQDAGDIGEARRLCEESIKINQELGNKGNMAISLAQLALLVERQGDLKAALKLTCQAEAIFEELGELHYAKKARKQLEWLEGKVDPISQLRSSDF